jgi:hypothetical protein
MGGGVKKDPRVDAYIAGAAPFARPILAEIRRRMHAAAPAAEETIRWGSPFFIYEGKLLCGMSAFKAHCNFGFWHPLMRVNDTSLEGMLEFGHLESVADLPPAAEIARLAKKAMKLVDEGVKAPARPKPAADRKVVVPPDLGAALAKNRKARETFDAFSYSARKEYVEWIGQAKRAETRAQRIATTVAQCAEGRKLHWKYEQR